MIILRLDFGLSFATAEALEERVRALTESEPAPQAVVLDFAGVDFIDSQGSEKLGEIRRLTAASDATLWLARVKPQVRELLPQTASSTRSAKSTSTETSTRPSRQRWRRLASAPRPRRPLRDEPTAHRSRAGRAVALRWLRSLEKRRIARNLAGVRSRPSATWRLWHDAPVILAIAILVVAIIGALAFGRWLQHKGTEIEKHD